MEILDLPKETVEQLVLLGEPIVFRVGSAMLLGSATVAIERGKGWRYELPDPSRELFSRWSKGHSDRSEACYLLVQAGLQAKETVSLLSIWLCIIGSAETLARLTDGSSIQWRLATMKPTLRLQRSGFMSARIRQRRSSISRRCSRAIPAM